MRERKRVTYQKIKVTLVRERTQEYFLRKAITNAPMIAGFLRALLMDEPQENFVGVYLDAKNRVIGTRTVSVGTAQSAIVHPRDVFIPAIALNAIGIIIAHNHPSGDPTPSQEDLTLTERLRSAGNILGIEILDHIVIGDQRFYSIAEYKSSEYLKSVNKSVNKSANKKEGEK